MRPDYQSRPNLFPVFNWNRDWNYLEILVPFHDHECGKSRVQLTHSFIVCPVWFHQGCFGVQIPGTEIIMGYCYLLQEKIQSTCIFYRSLWRSRVEVMVTVVAFVQRLRIARKSRRQEIWKYMSAGTINCVLLFPLMCLRWDSCCGFYFHL